MRALLRRYRAEAAAALGTFLAGLLPHLFSALRFPNDDQFILYRYIDHIAAGQGFVYNLGERVLGATTPLFTLLCSAVKVMLPGVATPELVAWINILLFSASAVYFYKLAARFLPQPYAYAACAVFAFDLAATIPEGMETPLFLLVMFAFFHYLFERRFYASAAFLSLMLLTRPDAGLIAVLAFVYWWREAGFLSAARYTAACIALASPWLIFATAYFGSPVPQSLAAKLHSSAIYSLPLWQAAKVQLADLSRIYWGRIFDPDYLPLQMALNLAPLLVLAAAGSWRAGSRKTWILFAAPALYFASFAISNPIVFPWYLSEMRPLWILASFIGLAWLLDKTRPLIAAAALAVVVLGPALGWAHLVVAHDRGSKVSLFQAGEYIGAHALPGDSVGIADIGIVGYLTQARIIDFIGLVSTSSVGYYPVGAECRAGFYTIPGKLIDDARPDWLVVNPAQFDRCWLKEGALERQYAPVLPGVWRRK